MDSPPFQAIPASVAKLVADGGKLQGLHSRLLDGNSNGAAMSTGFGSSPNFKGYDRDNGATPTLREADSNGSKIISAGASLLGDFPEQKPTAVSNAAKEPVVDKRESPPIAEEVPKVADEKLSGTKRPLPAEDEERSVITIEEESSRERKFRDKKSPKAAKSGGLTQYVDDAEGQQGSNQGDNSRGGVIAIQPGQTTLYRFLKQQPSGTMLANGENGAPVAAPPAPKPRGATKETKDKNPPTATGPVPSASSAADVAAATNELKKQADQMRVAKEQAEIKANHLESSLRSMSERMKSLEDRNGRLVKSLEDIHRKMAMQEFRRKRDQLALDCVRLGKIVTVRTGPTTMGDVWEEGYAMKELTKRSAELLSRKEELESRRKKIANTRRAITRKGQAAAAAAAAVAASSSFDADATLPFDPEVDVDMDLATEAEVIKSHLEQLRRDEIALAEERRMLEGEKAVHQKEIKRCQCEERSRFYRDLPTLHDRYLLQTMLGRGGFSEVWKALDLQELKEVAVKIHQLNPQWSEERKGSYIKHVTREYTIHRDMKHPRVVQLFDVFEIDMNSFATVLEYCRGIDLDEKLKRHKTLQEKDAKAIFMQILSGLRYLHHPYSYNASGLYLGPDGADNSTETATSSTTTTAASSSSGSSGAVSNNNVVHNTNSSTLIASSHGSGPGGNTGPTSTNNANNSHQVPNHLKRLSVIHFDLKPANILFDEFGDVKITDFGLSKVIDEAHEGTSMELTSQGAGTYWYLPPECFEKGPNPPRISSKVDVWSAGIIFFQILYGCRPFGEGKTQENVWTENIIYNASTVDFPNDAKAPKVSDDAKDLIRACLTRDQRLRPDIVGVCQHPYFKTK